MTEEVYDALAARIAAARERQIAFLRALVRTPSDNPPGDCAAHAEVVAKELEALGFAVERHPVPEDLVRARGMVSATNLIVRRRFGDGPTVALNAHGDVVPPGEGWTVDPYGGAVRDGAMYGRGVAVSKSDFATYAFALLALEGLGRPLAGAVELHFTYDEETGGEIGPRWILERGLSRPDFAICAGFSYGVVTAHNGCLHLAVTLRGRIAHAAMPETGIDALEAATNVLGALYEHRKGLAEKRSSAPGIGAPSLVVGLIEGGVNTNVVPDRVHFRLDRRIIPEEDAEAVEEELRALIAEAAARSPGAALAIERVMLARPLRPPPGSARLSDALARHAGRAFGVPIATCGTPLYTDARHYAEAGVPVALYGCGPRSLVEAGAHGADERIRLDDLERATLAVACALYDLLTGAR